MAPPTLIAALRTTNPHTYRFLSMIVAPSSARTHAHTHHPSGRYLRTTRGIFLSRSSLMAICNGSVSPSTSTKTGAFMLQPSMPPRQHPSLSRSPAAFLSSRTHLICSARVPRTRARSYLVMYGVVVRFFGSIFLDLMALTVLTSGGGTSPPGPEDNTIASTSWAVLSVGCAEGSPSGSPAPYSSECSRSSSSRRFSPCSLVDSHVSRRAGSRE